MWHPIGAGTRRWLLLLALSVASACHFPDYRFEGTSGAAGTAGGGGESNTGGTAGTGGSSGTGKEDCADGKDNDGDHAIDCADEDCKSNGWTCVKAIPEGWTGPVAFWSGANGDTAPDCSSSGGYTVPHLSSLYSELSTVVPSCPSCTCSGAVSGETRTARFQLETSQDGLGCAFLADSDLCPIALQEGCHSVALDRASLTSRTLSAACTSANCQLRMHTLAPQILGGSMLATPSGEMAAVEPKFKSVGRICEASSAPLKCESADNLCVQLPSGSFSREVCIYHGGDQLDCPAGWSAAKSIQYKGVVDNWSCSECTCPCEWPNVVHAVTVEDHGGDANCVNRPEVTSVNGGYTNTIAYLTGVSTEKRNFKTTVTPSGAPTCAAVPGELSGAITGTAPLTVCCTGT